MISDNPINISDPFSKSMPWRAKVHCEYRDVLWKVEGVGRELMIWKRDGNEGSDAAQNPVSVSVAASLRDFSFLLNMGIEHAEIGSIRWSGDTFTYTNSVEGNIWYLSGDVIPDDDGRAGHLTLSVTLSQRDYTAPRTVFWRIDYAYGDPPLSLPFLPNKITTHVIKSANDRVLDEYSISKVDVLDRPLPRDSFDWTNYVTSESQVFYVSNQNIVRFVNGRWEERWKPNDRRILSGKPPDRTKLRILYLTLIIVLFSPLLWIWRKGTRESKR